MRGRLYGSTAKGAVHGSIRKHQRCPVTLEQRQARRSKDTLQLRRTKATLIYRRTKNLRPVQILLGHTKLESTVRYLGIEVNDALEMAEQTEVSLDRGRAG